MFDELFNKKLSKAFYSYPFKVIYVLKNDLKETKFGLSVPKRNFKLAVNRNLIKRRIKEAYRVNQNILKTGTTNKFVLFFIYTSKSTLPYHKIDEAFIKVFNKIINASNAVD